MSALPALVPEEPKYIRENWRRILATDCPEHMRFVLIGDGGVATITNGKVLIRSRLDAPHHDGLYYISNQGDLVPLPRRGELGRYPDVNKVMPDFAKLAARRSQWNTMFNKDIAKFLQFCEEARSLQSIIKINRDSAVALAEPETVRFEFNFGDWINAHVDPDYLKLALIDMLKYEFIRIAREDHLRKDTPIVLGLNWDKCALVMPQRGV